MLHGILLQSTSHLHVRLKSWYIGVRTGHGKPGKSWNFRITLSRPGKSWNLSVGPEKFMENVY